MRALLFVALVALITGCNYITGPEPKYQACKHVEYRDSFAIGDTIRVVHLACPKKK